MSLRRDSSVTVVAIVSKFTNIINPANRQTFKTRPPKTYYSSRLFHEVPTLLLDTYSERF